MKQVTRDKFVEFGKCVDIVVCEASLLLTFALLCIPARETDRTLLASFHHLPFVVVLGLSWHFSLLTSGAYKSYRACSLAREALALARGTTLASIWSFVWLTIGGWNAAVEPHSLLSQVAIFWVLTFCGLSFSRACAHLLLQTLRRRGRNLRCVLVVGTCRRAIALAEQLEDNINFGYRIKGFVDNRWEFEAAPQRYHQRLLGSLTDLSTLLRELVVDEVIIGMPIALNDPRLHNIVDSCRVQGIPVRYDANARESDNRSIVSRYPQMRLVTLYDRRSSDFTTAVKRVVDVLISSLFLVILLPLFGLITVAIKISSRGSVIFAQERVGLGKRPFRMFKFRTMVADAESLLAIVEQLNQSKGPTFKLMNDPRITRVGAFLRKTSLDELPQLFNVFLGEMSLVGPRPLPMRDYLGFCEDWHRRRFSVKPGITCLWQVNGRSAISFERWMEMDMDYIDRWSLWLDFKILLCTIPAVLRGAGAM